MNRPTQYSADARQHEIQHIAFVQASGRIGTGELTNYDTDAVLQAVSTFTGSSPVQNPLPLLHVLNYQSFKTRDQKKAAIAVIRPLPEYNSSVGVFLSGGAGKTLVAAFYAALQEYVRAQAELAAEQDCTSPLAKLKLPPLQIV